jgi:hypothetical protein
LPLFYRARYQAWHAEHASELVCGEMTEVALPPEDLAANHHIQNGKECLLKSEIFECNGE